MCVCVCVHAILPSQWPTPYTTLPFSCWCGWSEEWAKEMDSLFWWRQSYHFPWRTRWLQSRWNKTNVEDIELVSFIMNILIVSYYGFFDFSFLSFVFTYLHAFSLPFVLLWKPFLLRYFLLCRCTLFCSNLLHYYHIS